MNISPELIRISESRGIPVGVTLAIILELSNGSIFWRREGLESKREIIEASKFTGFTTEELSGFLSLSANYAAAFNFDGATWNTYGRMDNLSKANRFLLSCRVGLARYPAHKLVLENPVPVTEWESTIKEFCLSTDKQLEMLVSEIYNNSRPRNGKEKAGILLGISRIFHPEADVIMPETQKVLLRAKYISEGYEAQKRAEAQARQAKPPDSSPTEKPKTFSQVISG